MKPIIIELAHEQVDEIMVQGLKNAYDNLCVDCGVPMFSSDSEEEARKMKKLLKGFKQVYWYYTGDKLK